MRLLKGSVFQLVLLVLASTTFGQQEITVGSIEYQEAKLAGTLDQYTIVYTLEDFHPIHKVKTKPLLNEGQQKSGNCDCYIEPDASYTLALAPNDDGSSALINIPFDFNFYGQVYTNFYINNNGNITFDSPMSSFSPTAFPSSGPKIIAPFWGDVDTRGGNGQVLYKITPNAIYINWESVGYYDEHGDLLNTFQLIISDGTDPAIPGGNNVAFCYQDMQWTTGDASGGLNGFPYSNPLIYATCGTNKGDNVSFFQLAQFGHPGTDFDGAMGNDDGVSWLDNQKFYFSTAQSNNVAPIIVEQIDCDTIYIGTWGLQVVIPIIAFSPESNQINTLTFDNGGLNSLELLSLNNANTSSLEFQIIGNDQDNGVYNITVYAQDDDLINPGLSQYTFTVVIDIDCSVPDIPQAVFTQSSSTILVDEDVQFTQFSCGVPTAWNWTVSPGTENQDWEFINGTTASSENPQIHFSTFGMYSVSLEVSNGFGADSIFMEHAVTVLGIPGSCSAASMIGCFDAANNPYISNVKLGTFENNSTCSEYSNYSVQVLPVYQDSTYVLEITSGITGIGPDSLSDSHKVGVWIDWNQNGDFTDAYEFIGLTSHLSSGKSSVSFQVPGTANTGQIPVRIRIAETDTIEVSPCDFNIKGEVEDYTLEVSDQGVSGVSLISSIEDVALYPNPITDILFINAIGYEVEIEILDLNGKKIIPRLGLNDGINEIDLSNVDCGVYIIRIYGREEFITKRVIKS